MTIIKQTIILSQCSLRQLYPSYPSEWEYISVEKSILVRNLKVS